MKLVEKTIGGGVLSKDGLLYIKNKTLTNGRTYWECAQRRSGNGCNQKQPPEVFCKKGGLRNFAKFTGKHLRQRLFFKKKRVSGISACEISKNTFFTEHLWATASDAMSK